MKYGETSQSKMYVFDLLLFRGMHPCREMRPLVKHFAGCLAKISEYCQSVNKVNFYGRKKCEPMTKEPNVSGPQTPTLHKEWRGVHDIVHDRGAYHATTPASRQIDREVGHPSIAFIPNQDQ